MKLLKLLLASGTLLVCLPGRAQNDYLQMAVKDSLISCENNDSLKTVRLIKLLKSVDIDSISANRHIYYRDMGMCYYNLFFHGAGTQYLNLAIHEYDLSITQDSTYSLPYWDAAISYYLLKDCKRSNEYLKKYMALAPKREWDKNSIKVIKKGCKNKS